MRARNVCVFVLCILHCAQTIKYFIRDGGAVIIA
jgi:hypothetical protein